MAVGVGDLTTMTFATSGWTPEIVSINRGGLSRTVIDRTHLGSQGWRQYLLSNIVNAGTCSLNIHFDPADTIPFGPSVAFETITIDFGDSGDTESFSGAISSVDNINVVTDEIMSATIEITIDGEPTGFTS